MPLVRVRVTDADGGPLAGRTVSAEPYTGNHYPSARAAADRRTAVSGADGWVSFQVPAGHWLLRGLGASGTVTAVAAAPAGRDLVIVPSTRLPRGNGGLPAHAGPRDGGYDPVTSVYNLTADAVRRLRGALAAARCGAGLCRLAFCGDSLTQGFTTVPGTDDPVSQLAAEFARQGYPTGQLVHFWSNASPPDPRIPGASLSGAYNEFPWPKLAAAADLSFTGTGTVLEIVTWDYVGDFTYAIDGAAAVPVTTGGSPVARRITVTGLSNAAHTVTLHAGTSGAWLYSIGFRQATGIAFENAGIAGSSVAAWLDVTNAFGPSASLFQDANVDHDAVVIELGVNELFQATPVDTFRANLGALVDQAADTGADVLLAASNYPVGHGADWPGYVSAIYDVADTRGVPLLDFADRFGLSAQYDTGSVAYDEATDGTHMTRVGNAHRARAYAQLLTV